MRRVHLVLDFFILGISATMVQVVLFRTLLQTSLGNELVIGVILGIYILFSGLGSLLSPKFPQKVFPIILFAVPFISLLSVSIALIPSRLFGLMSGEAPALWQILLLSTATIGLNGFLLGTAYGTLFHKYQLKEGHVSNAYFSEALGSGLAGAVFTYVLATQLLSIQSIALFSMIWLMWLWHKKIFPRIWTSAAIGLFGIVFLAGRPVEKWLSEKNMRGYELVELVNSRYGKIAITERGGELTVFHNGGILLTWPNPDFEHIEALSHIPIYCSPNPERILLIGGGPDIISEILKHKEVKKLIYAQPDPKILETLSEMGLFPKDNRLQAVVSDARAYLNRSHEQFDVVIIDLPPPLTLTLNRFYTVQFWKLLKSHLSPNGVVSFTLPWSYSYVPEELEAMNFSIKNAVQREFAFTEAYQDGENLFLASDIIVDASTAVRNMEKHPVETGIVTQDYITYRFSRPALMLSDRDFPPNDDFHPITVLYSLIYWTLAFSPSVRTAMMQFLKLKPIHTIAFVIIVGLFLLPLIKKRQNRLITMIVFTTGMTAMAFDIVPMMVFQVKYGYIYEAIGMLLAAFHIGLALGGIASLKLKVRKWELLLSEILILVVLFMLLFLPLLPLSGIYLSAVMGGAAAGLQFPLAVNFYREHAGRLYGVDLFGGTAAALIISPILIPILGFTYTLVALIAIKSMSLIYLSLSGSISGQEPF